MSTYKSTATLTGIPEVQSERKEDQSVSPQPHTKATAPEDSIPQPVPKKYDLSVFSRKKLIRWASYRVPMKIIEGIIVPSYLGPTVYYICPRCQVSMEREYTSFCDRCGQRLDWRGCCKAKLRRAGEARLREEQSK